MNNNIDDIFKNGLEGMEFSGKEAIWEKMEQNLPKQPESEKKKYLLLAFLLIFVVIGISLLYSHFNKSKGIEVHPLNTAAKTKHSPKANNETQTETNDIKKIAVSKRSFLDTNKIESKISLDFNKSIKIFSTKEKKTAAISYQRKKQQRNDGTLNGKNNTTLVQDEELVTLNENDKKVEGILHLKKIKCEFEKEMYANASTINTAIVAVAPLPHALEPHKKITTIRKNKLAAVAGTDVFKLSKGAGYYAGLTLSRSCSKGMYFSVGVNYTASNVSESYRLSNKPTQLQQADAEISRLKMLRFPIMIEQQIGKGKFTALAGLVPLYILDAAIYNLPPSVSGNPTNFRKFTINDMKRLNVLFNTGIRYNLSPRIGVELSGSYGLTELVKNSYINQSSVNGNFKNVQLGIIVLLK
jgi:hypothetical protein